jgi:phosphate-selective porin OprO/OprP
MLSSENAMPYRKVLLGSVLMILGIHSIPAKAQSLEQQIEELRQKLSDLEQQVKINARKEDLKAEETAEKAKGAPSVSAGANGFLLRSGAGESGDGASDFQLKIGADIQIDNRTFPGESRVPLTDQILLRRIRPTFSGTVFRYVDFYLRPDFGQGSTILYDAFLQLNYFSRANVRVGKFKPPVGLERLQSDDDTNFVERGFPTLLAPSRDIGYQVSGDIVKNRVNYAVGVFNGVPDNSLSDSSASDHRDYAARLFLTPFQPDTHNPLRGLGIGIGASSGNDDSIALPSYKTFGQNTFFTFASGVTSAGHRTRLAPQAYYYLGPFGLLAEYTLTEEGFEKGSVRRDIAFRAWQVQATYLLTGERKGFGTLTPHRAFDPSNHGWGALELAVRVGDFSAENGIYNYGFALPTTTPRRAHEWVGGINWYLNRMLRISLDYGNTNFEGGAAHGDRASEKALLERFQVNF